MNYIKCLIGAMGCSFWSFVVSLSKMTTLIFFLV